MRLQIDLPRFAPGAGAGSVRRYVGPGSRLRDDGRRNRRCRFTGGWGYSMRRIFFLGSLFLGGVVGCQPVTGLNRDSAAGGIGSRGFVVERSSEALAVYDFELRRVVGR